MTDDNLVLPVCGLAVAASVTGLHILAAWVGFGL